MGKSAYQQELTEAMQGRLVISPGVGAVIRNEQGWILIERREDNGEWDLPAGAVEPGETPREAIVREVREETGLDVTVTDIAGVFGGERFRHTYPDGQKVEAFAVIFECERVGGRLRGEDGEASQFRYVAADEMPRLMWPYPRALFGAGRRAPVVE